jgi:Arc/MetJ-type ribon-helix-helix transcriptional regulator
MAKRPTKMSGFIGLRLDPDMQKEIEDWINSMRPRPSKSEAMRTLIEEGLRAVKAEKPAKKGKP